MANPQQNETIKGRAAKTAKSATTKTTEPATESVTGKTADAVESAGKGAARAADSTGTGAAHAVASTGAALASARDNVTSAAQRVTSVATTAWALVKNRKAVAAGVGVGATALVATSFAAGRRAERAGQGPVTRLTGGRV
ncbi:hypothetical protein ACIBL6_16425 [Streptomyces sp. NPDC050400]|uniref:hypothetical protein n=1 Tax=Streptomyces sp. NPDC050400 TaxID=3365610 RepID=UPI0037976A29